MDGAKKINMDKQDAQDVIPIILPILSINVKINN